MYSDRKSVSNRDMYNNGNSSGYGRQGYDNYRAGNGSNQDMRSTYQQDFNQYQQAPPRSPHYQHHQDYRSPSRTHSEPRIAYGKQGYNRGYGGNGASGSGGYNSGYRQQQTPTKSSGYGYNRNSSRNPRDQPKQVSKFDLERKATIGRAEEDKKKIVVSTVSKSAQLPLERTVQNQESTDKAKTVESSRTNDDQSIPVAVPVKSIPVIVIVPPEETPVENPVSVPCTSEEEIFPEALVISSEVEVVCETSTAETVLEQCIVPSVQIPILDKISNPDPVPEESSNQEPVPKETSNPEPVPEISSNQEPILEETSNPEPVPEISSNQEPILEETSNPEPVPETSANPETVPEASSNPETVPDEASSNLETVPESSSNPETAPVTSSNPETVPVTSSNPETVPEASSNPETVSEVSSKLESVPEASSKLESVPESSSESEPIPEVSSSQEPISVSNKEDSEQIVEVCSNEPLPMQGDTTVLKKELSPKENEEAPKKTQVEDDIADKLDNMYITPSKSSRKSKILLDSTNIIESSSITFVEVRKKDDPTGVQLTPVRRSTRKKTNPQKISEETLSKAKLVPNPFLK